ncbi:MAG: hypothetical protein DBX59_02225 [Bacillota bacterium]|nr:MAG: hypothetical protein DBX59_02225 [Bacillota bacterium]
MDILSNFADKLKELMNYSEIAESALADRVGIDVSQIRRYLRKDCLPSLTSAVKLADYFKCPLDYLFGRAEDFTEQNYPVCPPFGGHFAAFLEKNNCTRYRLSRQLRGLTQCRMHAWVHGISTPSVENLIRISDYFKCSLDELVGREP